MSETLPEAREAELLVPTEFPPDEFPDPDQAPIDLGVEEEVHDD